MNKYLRCRTCDIQLQDTKHSTFFIEHMNKNEYICLNENCMKEYLLETHSRLNLIVSR